MDNFRKPYLLNYCKECYETWFCNVFLSVLPCLRFSIWSDELFLQILKVTFFSQSDHTIGFCKKFLWIWKKINFLRPTVQKLRPIEFFSKILAILAKKTLLKICKHVQYKKCLRFFSHIFIKKIFESKAMHFSSIFIINICEKTA